MLQAIRTQSSNGRILAPLLELYAFESLLGFKKRSKLFIRGTRGSEAAEEDGGDRSAGFSSNGPLRQVPVVAEALAFSICDSVRRPGQAKWFHASMLLGREYALFERDTMVRVDKCWRTFVMSRVHRRRGSRPAGSYATEYQGLLLRTVSDSNSANMMVGVMAAGAVWGGC